MKCIYCGCEESKVLDSRSTDETNSQLMKLLKQLQFWLSKMMVLVNHLRQAKLRAGLSKLVKNAL